MEQERQEGLFHCHLKDTTYAQLEDLSETDTVSQKGLILISHQSRSDLMIIWALRSIKWGLINTRLKWLIQWEENCFNGS